MSTKSRPMHYIAQPDLKISPGKMQKNFIVNREKKSAAFDLNGKVVVENYTLEKDFSKKTNRSHLKTSPQSEKSTEKKAFKDMNIEERIRFLTERPFFIPPSPCEIETKTQSYFGFIESCERGVMQVRHLNRQEVFQVDRKDVTGILLLRM